MKKVVSVVLANNLDWETGHMKTSAIFIRRKKTEPVFFPQSRYVLTTASLRRLSQALRPENLRFLQLMPYGIWFDIK